MYRYKSDMMVTKPLDKRAFNEIKLLHQRNKHLMDLKIRALGVKGKEDFIRSFTISPLYQYIKLFTSECDRCIENINPNLDPNDIMKISTYIELMNTLGWKNWKVSLQEEENQEKAKKELLEKVALQKKKDEEERLQEEIFQKKKAKEERLEKTLQKKKEREETEKKRLQKEILREETEKKRLQEEILREEILREETEKKRLQEEILQKKKNEERL